MNDECNTDFDFLVGRWRVHHRRLKSRLAHCTEWEEFGGTSDLRLLMNGHGTIDENVIELPAGSYRAVTLRSYDASTREWAIWWLDGRDPHRMDVPMKGRFDHDGVGRFFADETFNSHPIRVRFLWSDITPSTCRWQQAFSPDGGATWETNWVMDFTRID
jgi:hypothetical protein